jgi:hypothetical protein
MKTKTLLRRDCLVDIVSPTGRANPRVTRMVGHRGHCTARSGHPTHTEFIDNSVLDHAERPCRGHRSPARPQRTPRRRSRRCPWLLVSPVLPLDASAYAIADSGFARGWTCGASREMIARGLRELLQAHIVPGRVTARLDSICQALRGDLLRFPPRSPAGTPGRPGCATRRWGVQPWPRRASGRLFSEGAFAGQNRDCRPLTAEKLG